MLKKEPAKQEVEFAQIKAQRINTLNSMLIIPTLSAPKTVYKMQ